MIYSFFVYTYKIIYFEGLLGRIFPRLSFRKITNHQKGPTRTAWPVPCVQLPGNCQSCRCRRHGKLSAQMVANLVEESEYIGEYKGYIL